MDNSFVMSLDESHSLNFLIYLQNIYLNQHRKGEHLKYPYLSTTVPFKEDFEKRFKELWDDVFQQILKDKVHDLNIFHKEKYLFYERLFVTNDSSLTLFDEIITAFEVWWISNVGHFAIERSVDELVHPVYLELANFLKESKRTPKKNLHISLIYDDCLFVQNKIFSYFAVISLNEVIFKQEELALKLRACFD
ncbi:hypothetical protein H9636_04600 [Ureibacillus sp. Re31]|uniref:Group-specific protein n=1 Tax=Ureibacillus galli TaxID=2762222 RepID=A0ABR8X9D3_9BACL|nr:hypothetical protein [Ureibacillus galli]MBD8025934.1 hypothetical protein [Ureibacillus galli]